MKSQKRNKTPRKRGSLITKNKTMYKQNEMKRGSLKVNKAYEGETIEMKINRILNNREPIKDGAPIIYTERKEGVKPEHNIRTDRFELAVDAMDKVNSSKLAKREERINPKEEAKVVDFDKKVDGEAKPLQGTDNK